MRVADYQSFSLSAWHFSLVLTNVFLQIAYWLRIQKTVLLHKCYNQFFQIIKVLWQRPRIFTYFFLFMLFALSRVIFLALTLYYPQKIDSYFDRGSLLFSLFVPHLNVQSESLVFERKGKLQASLKSEIVSKVIETDNHHVCRASVYYEVVNFTSRNLNFINLNDSVICGGDFSKSSMFNAGLEKAKIQAIFNQAKLEGASFIGAHLHSQSRFALSQLNNSRFDYSTANGVDFTLSKMKKVSFLSTSLNHAIFLQADVGKSAFTQSSLNHSN